MNSAFTGKILPPYPLRPLVQIKTPFPKSRFILPEELRLFPIKSSILIILAAQISSLDVFYLNLISKKMFSCKTIQLPLPIEDFWEPNLSIGQLHDQLVVLLRISNSIFQVFSLKTLKLIWGIDYTQFSKRKVYCTLIPNQMVTWTEDSVQLRFWTVSQNKVQSTLELPSKPGNAFTVLMKRNLLVLQSQNKQNLFIIDAKSQELKHIIKISSAQELITGTSYTKNTIFTSKTSGIQSLLITKYFLDEQLKLQEAHSTPKFSIDPIMRRFEEADIVSFYEIGALFLAEYREDKWTVQYLLDKLGGNHVYDCTILHSGRLACLLDSSNILLLYKLFSPKAPKLGNV